VDGLVAGLTAEGRALIEAFWPGPLTVLARPQPTLAWDLGTPAGATPAVAVRMPLHPLALDLLRATGPLVVTGANVVGMPLPVTCDEAEEQLGDFVTVYLDAGPVPGGAPSGVVDLTGPVPTLVREGGFPVEVLREVCPTLRLPGEASDPA
jgi:tRNA threonylcarbamoyl adenosine modification protein (Sua5/YciO/YrdC/YwlC family)